MWTARILILVILLLLGGGWFDKLISKREKVAAVLLLPVIFALSCVSTLREPLVRVCFAPCVFALACALVCPTEHPFGAIAAAVLGGTVGWKLCDALPLFPEQGFLIAAPTVLLAALYGRDRNARLLAVAASPFIMLLLRAIGDYTLFQSAVLEIGSEDALAAQTAGLFLLLPGGFVHERLQSARQRVHASA